VKGEEGGGKRQKMRKEEWVRQGRKERWSRGREEGRKETKKRRKKGEGRRMRR